MDGMNGPEPGMARAPRGVALASHLSKPTAADPTDSYHAAELVVQLGEPGQMHARDDVPRRLDSLLEQGARTVIVDMSRVGLARMDIGTLDHPAGEIPTMRRA
jgi:hypothetical protein